MVYKRSINYLRFLIAITGSIDNLSLSSEMMMPLAQKDSSSVELNTAANHDDNTDAHNDSKDNLPDNSSSLLDTSSQHQTSNYGVELSQEDQITLLVETTDSKLSDIQ